MCVAALLLQRRFDRIAHKTDVLFAQIWVHRKGNDPLTQALGDRTGDRLLQLVKCSLQVHNLMYSDMIC